MLSSYWLTNYSSLPSNNIVTKWYDLAIRDTKCSKVKHGLITFRSHVAIGLSFPSSSPISIFLRFLGHQTFRYFNVVQTALFLTLYIEGLSEYYVNVLVLCWYLPYAVQTLKHNVDKFLLLAIAKSKTRKPPELFSILLPNPLVKITFKRPGSCSIFVSFLLIKFLKLARDTSIITKVPASS